MYQENPEGTQVIVGSMNMGYISSLISIAQQGHPGELFLPFLPVSFIGAWDKQEKARHGEFFYI